MNSPEVKKLIRTNEYLFWYIKKDKLEDISHPVLVEFILNFGTAKAVKDLFALLGVDYVSEIFYEHSIPGKRTNYFPLTIHYFNLYFKRHASRSFVRRTEEATTAHQ
jgi:hypothetical protein